MINNMKDKSKSIFAGIFILVAYGVLASALTQNKLIVIAADVISGLAVIGIAVLLLPFFKSASKKITYSYIFLKLLEGLLMIIAGLFFLIDSTQYLRDWIYNNIHVYAFIMGGFIFYYLLLKSKIVPRFISVWGALGIFALLASALLKLMNIQYPVIDYFLILIITNEIFLAVWLMTKGVKTQQTN